MWWNDIKEIKHWMNRLTDRLVRIDQNVEKIVARQDVVKEISIPNDILASAISEIKDCIIDQLESEDEFNSINRIHDKLNSLLKEEEMEERVELATKTLDKFEDYMKNVDKLNAMVNEFKGCVSLARGALEDRKQVADKEAENATLAQMTKDIHKSMLAFIAAGDKIKHEAHFKIDFIYKNIEKIADILQKQEKKSRKRTKRKAKKRAASQAPLSE